jgi:hypothetical protein
VCNVLERLKVSIALRNASGLPIHIQGAASSAIDAFWALDFSAWTCPSNGATSNGARYTKCSEVEFG